MGDFNYMDYLKNNPLLKKNADFSLIKESQEGTSSKMKKSELKAKIKENILSTLNEEDLDRNSSIKDQVRTMSRMFFDLDDDQDFPEFGEPVNPANKAWERAYDKFSKQIGKKYITDFTEDELKSILNIGEKIKQKYLAGGKSLNEEDEDYERASREVEYGDSYSELENELLADLEESLNEAKDEDEEDVDVEDEDIEDEVGGGDAEALDPEAGLSQDEQDIQNALKVAYDNAVELGDEKLSKQIGNTITMFTRTRVVGDLQ